MLIEKKQKKKEAKNKRGKKLQTLFIKLKRPHYRVRGGTGYVEFRILSHVENVKLCYYMLELTREKESKVLVASPLPRRMSNR